MSDASKDNQVNLDEIDIDAILNTAIGSTGRPSVPSADEKLPSLIEEDVIDVKAFLKEVAEQEAAEKRLASPEEAMDTIDTDSLFDAFQVENVETEPIPVETSLALAKAIPTNPISATPQAITPEPVKTVAPVITPPSPPKSTKLSPPPTPAESYDTKAGLDDIDIDAILNASIGSTGQPSVPSADEKLPSLFEEDVIDVEEFLKEMAEKEALENSVSSSEDAMETIDTDALFNESQLDQLMAEEVELAAVTHDAELLTPVEATEANEIVTAVSLEAPQADEIPETINLLKEDTSIALGKLLSQEATAIEVGGLPIPAVPAALSFTATRRFSTHPKRHLSYLQKQSIFYAVGILIWLASTSYISIKMYQRHSAFKQAAQLKTVTSKPIKPALKPLPPKKLPAVLPVTPPLPVTSTQPIPGKPGKPNQEAVSTPQDLDQKDGIENFDPVQCNLEMDSPNIREELEKCLRAAKVMNQ
ncbi:MAG: hypothetical protein V4525_14925 [Pseudomonadota bacterium]